MSKDKELRLVITCTEQNKTNDVVGSRISFYLKRGGMPKEFVDSWTIPIMTARRSLKLFNSPWKKELMDKVKKLQEVYNIPDEHVDSFVGCTEKAEARYQAMLEKRRKKNKEEKAERLKEYREVKKHEGMMSPELKGALDETRAQIKKKG